MRQNKKYIALAAAAACFLSGCNVKPQLSRYDAQFLQLFDTVTSVVGYAKDKETFTAYVQEFHDELEEYHQLYDIYNEYEGINNLKTINDHAGIQPIEVDQRIIDLLEEALEMYELTDGYMNIAMGSVLEIWHDYRTEGIDNPLEASLPPMEALIEASEHTSIEDIVIDREQSTVYLKDPDMSLDVGAIAKGYATEMVCRKMAEEGISNVMVSVGGNIRAIGTKPDGSPWNVGIQNPDMESEEKYLHTVSVQDQSLVTSGSYQRYYTVDGVQYHHIVNPDTLMPGNEYVSVSILCQDSGMADALSTAAFNRNLEDGKKMIESIGGAEALWVFPDGREVCTPGFQALMDQNG